MEEFQGKAEAAESGGWQGSSASPSLDMFAFNIFQLAAVLHGWVCLKEFINYTI